MTTFIFRFFWALFLAIIMWSSFRRSWKIEHGEQQSLIGNTDESVVWATPLIFPLMIAAFCSIHLLLTGTEGLAAFIMLEFGIFMNMTVYFIVLLLLLPLFRRYFSARACATLWLFPVLLFYQPTILTEYTVYPPLFTICIPSSGLRVFFYIWLLGFAIIFAGQVISNFVFRHKLLRGAREIEDSGILALWEKEKSNIHYKKSVKLLAAPNAATPLSMGIFQKSCVTLLPDRQYTPDELRFVFRHELRHIQRRDVDTKIFLAFCRAMCWFNPLVWIAIGKASDDLELSCDEIVLENASKQERLQYAKLLLHTAGSSHGFTTCLSAAASSLRYRLKRVTQPYEKRRGIALLTVMLFVCCMSYGILTLTTARGEVGSLVLEGTETEDVIYLEYYDGESSTSDVCSEELLSYLKSLEVERLLGDKRLNDEIVPELNCEIAAGEKSLNLIFNARYLRIADSDLDQNTYYIMRSDLDMEYIKGLLR